MAQARESDFRMLRISACRSMPIPFIQAVRFHPFGVGTPDQMLKLPIPGIVKSVVQFELTLRVIDQTCSSVLTVAAAERSPVTSPVAAEARWASIT